MNTPKRGRPRTAASIALSARMARMKLKKGKTLREIAEFFGDQLGRDFSQAAISARIQRYQLEQRAA